jgi:hypothetical protein
MKFYCDMHAQILNALFMLPDGKDAGSDKYAGAGERLCH